MSKPLHSKITPSPLIYLDTSTRYMYSQACCRPEARFAGSKSSPQLGWNLLRFSIACQRPKDGGLRAESCGPIPSHHLIICARHFLNPLIWFRTGEKWGLGRDGYDLPRDVEAAQGTQTRSESAPSPGDKTTSSQLYPQGSGPQGSDPPQPNPQPNCSRCLLRVLNAAFSKLRPPRP